MKPLGIIFRTLRKQKRYQFQSLTNSLVASTAAINGYERGNNIPAHLLEPWAKFLDLSDDQLDWVYRYIRTYDTFKLLPTELPETTRYRLAQLLSVGDCLPKRDISEIEDILLKKALPFLPEVPHSIASLTYDE